MSINRNLIAAGLAVLLFAGSASAYIGQEYVVNGDFETGDMTGWSWHIDTNARLITDTPPLPGGQGGVGGNYAAEYDWATNQYIMQDIYLKDDHTAITEDLNLSLTLWFSGVTNVMVRDTFGSDRYGPYIMSNDFWWTYSEDGVPPQPYYGDWTYADRPSNTIFVYPAVYGPTPWRIIIPAGVASITIQFGGSYAVAADHRLDNVSLIEIERALLAGDVNEDEIVNGLDWNRVITNWGMFGPTVTRAHGDLDGDFTVGAADYNEVIDNWGSIYAPEPPGAIPEPSTLLFLAGGVLAGLIRRR